MDRVPKVQKDDFSPWAARSADGVEANARTAWPDRAPDLGPVMLSIDRLRAVEFPSRRTEVASEIEGVQRQRETGPVSLARQKALAMRVLCESCHVENQ